MPLEPWNHIPVNLQFRQVHWLGLRWYRYFNVVQFVVMSLIPCIANNDCSWTCVPPRDYFDLSFALHFIKAAHVLDACLVVSHLGCFCVVLLLISDITIFIFFVVVEAGGGSTWRFVENKPNIVKQLFVGAQNGKVNASQCITKYMNHWDTLSKVHINFYIVLVMEKTFEGSKRKSVFA